MRTRSPVPAPAPVSAPVPVPAPVRARRPVASAAALAVLAAGVLSGCGASDGGGSERAEDTAAPSSPPAAGAGQDELGTHGRPCPERLPESDDPTNRFGPSAPAEAAPTLPSFEELWVCRYQPSEESSGGSAGPDGTSYGWLLVGEPQGVPAGERGAITDALGRLEPAEPDRMCTADLGPRWLLAGSVSGDLTGVVVDDFGCREVRLTPDPFEVVAGEGEGEDAGEDVVAGVLTGPPGLVEELRSLHRAKGASAGTALSPSVDDLDCDSQERSMFMRDAVDPGPGITLREAVEPWADEGEVVLGPRQGDRATATVVVDGRTVTSLSLLRHPSGSWAVESGVEC